MSLTRAQRLGVWLQARGLDRLAEPLDEAGEALALVCESAPEAAVALGALRAVADELSVAPVALGDADDLAAHREIISLAATPATREATLRRAEGLCALLERGVALADVLDELVEPQPAEAPTSAVRFDMAGFFEAPEQAQPGEVLFDHARRAEATDWLAQTLPPPRAAYPPALLDAHVIGVFPTRAPWEIPAWLGLGGWDDHPSTAHHVALWRWWAERAGVEPLLVTPTRHTLYARQRPSAWVQAFELAQHHLDYCPPLARQHNLRQRAQTLRDEGLWRFDWS